MSDSSLAPLREDLSLSRGPLARGIPNWTLYDPARHRYLRLGWLDFEILTRWHLRTPRAIVQALNAETTLRATESDVVQFAAFASDAGLLRASSPSDTARLLRISEGRRRSPITWLIHNYLFLRIRLVNPDRFLEAMLPLVRPLFSVAGLVFIVMLGVVGLFLISREWETYTHSLIEQYSVEGLLGMAVALSFAKVFHELGHGFAAKRFGCRVPSMGVALLVLWPVLWTDTTDAWRLADRRQRLVIDVAGMSAEIMLAALASIAWAVLPDGPARSAMFVLSSSTWVLTLFVNIVPLLRFDGYYILSDLIDVPNLQERGFAYTRWWMRELLFRPGVSPPEYPPPDLARILVVYSLACWIYRFFLFIGIAVLVYQVTFKALGIVLAAIELWFFVVRPIASEMAAWIPLLARSRPGKHTYATLGFVVLMAVLLFVPWRGRVDAPGIVRAEQQTVLLAAEPGRLVSMASQNVQVAAGQELFRLESAEVSHSMAVARAQLESAQAALASSPFDPDRRRSQQASFARASEAAAALARAELRSANLRLRAPFTGQLKDVPPDLRIGDDVRRLERLGVLVASSAPLVEAYVAEPDLDRVAIGADAWLVLLDGRTVPLTVTEIARSSTRVFEVPELSSAHAGPVAVRRGASGTMVPEGAIYRVLLRGSNAEEISSRIVGRVVIKAPPRSFADIVYRKFVALLLRESSV